MTEVHAETLLRIDGSRGDFIGQGVVRDFTEADGTFVIERQTTHSIQFLFRGEGNVAYALEFYAPEGQALAPGMYENAEHWTDDAPLQPDFRAHAFGHSCNTNRGRFVVRELLRDPGNGEITAFAADFEHYCDGQDLPLFGELRLASTVPLGVATPTAAAGADQVALERQGVVLDGRESMPGSAAIAEWHWSQVAGPAVALSGSDASVATFTAPAAVAAPGETLQFELRTVNAAGLADTDVVEVFVQDKVSPRSVASVIGDGAIGLLPVDQRLTLPSQDGLFEGVDLGFGRAVVHVRWRGTRYNWFFNLIADAPLAIGHYDIHPNYGNPRTSVEAASTRCDRVQGTFDVLDIGFSGDRASSLALNFVQYCDFLQVPLRGKLRFNVAIPDAHAGQDVQAEGRDTVSLTAAASEAAVGALRTFHWRQVAGPTVAVQGADQPNASFTAPDVAVATKLEFELTVTDDRGIDDSDVVAVNLTPAASPPPPPSPAPPPASGGGGGGGGAAGWGAIALLGLVGFRTRRKSRGH